MINPEAAPAVAASNAATGLLATLLAPGKEGVKSQAELRERMHEKAGPEHFQNEALLEAREKLRPQTAGFAAFRIKMSNPQFQDTLHTFQSTEGVSTTGSVAAQAGMNRRRSATTSPTAIQPVLGAVLPRFVK